MSEIKNDSLEYKYAEALLIVFNKYADVYSQAIHFNHKDLYELIKAEDAGRNFVSVDLINQLANTKDSETYKKLFKEIESLNNTRLDKEKQVYKFMLEVNSALNLIVLCDKYKRQLILTQLEEEEWIAVDISKIKITKISF